MKSYSAEFLGTFWLVLGAIVAGGVLYVIASGKAGFDVTAGFASNGYGAYSPGRYSLLAALVCKVVMTMMFFLVVILGAADKRAPAGFHLSLSVWRSRSFT
jgi:aquaporin Z